MKRNLCLIADTRIITQKKNGWEFSKQICNVYPKEELIQFATKTKETPLVSCWHNVIIQKKTPEIPIQVIFSNGGVLCCDLNTSILVYMNEKLYYSKISNVVSLQETNKFPIFNIKGHNISITSISGMTANANFFDIIPISESFSYFNPIHGIPIKLSKKLDDVVVLCNT